MKDRIGLRWTQIVEENFYNIIDGKVQRKLILSGSRKLYSILGLTIDKAGLVIQ